MSVQEVQATNYVMQEPLKNSSGKAEENDVSIYDALRTNSYSYGVSKNSSFESFLKDTEYDGNNDGKVDLKTGLKCFGSGILDNIKGKVNQVVDFAKEHPVLAVGAAALTIGAGVLIGAAVPALVAAETISLATAGAIQTGIGLVGVGYGLYKAAPAVKEGLDKYQDFKDADTDMEALKALHDMGSNSVDATEGAVIALMGAKTAADGIATMACESKMGFLSRFKPKDVARAEKSLYEASHATYNNDPNGLRQYTAEYYASSYLTSAQNGVLNSGNIDGGILGGLTGMNIYTGDIAEAFN